MLTRWMYSGMYEYAAPSTPLRLASSRCVYRALRSMTSLYHRVCRSSKDFLRNSSADHERPAFVSQRVSNLLDWAQCVAYAYHFCPSLHRVFGSTLLARIPLVCLSHPPSDQQTGTAAHHCGPRLCFT